ncbi:hormogonium polysaccharide biosynthesis glycosyltransferase HpsE [Oscillatoria sp. FACHB-1406]|uniref:hormogonium polysaccharide biosynthesis glycosyltransferase HpsE n=1 Tax=Oscillatoria sp. FACHB-1406 TaxID=2692846 RepID=UPI001682DFED|nr:hormogonium polysaccharide biosynthesis glycosyltransferase HpsE [Oscillatoria sp. FACHB-1406]MBD2576688.1 glycosyltransferase family 2 protein [Oscillatoria sp. FACHB-1406]
MDFTVAIPTYNGASRLSEVIEKLKAQIGTENIAWEILVIDNNSSDNTAQIVQEFQTHWSYPFPLQYHFEPEQGLAYARQRAINEAKGTFLGFIDDDNLVAPNWVAEALSFGREHPRAGAYGGQIHPAFEVPPPENFENIIGFLAIRERDTQPQQYNPKILSLPPGAGLVARVQAWRECFSKPSLFAGRLGKSMVGGEDWEPLIYMHKAGWEIWYAPNLHLDHKIPASRLSEDYLLSLIHGSCLCFYPLRLLQASPTEQPALLARTVLGNWLKAASYYLKNRRKLKTDLVAKCELQIYWSRALSPFYFFKQRYL